MKTLVDGASFVLGLHAGGTLMERLKLCFDRVARSGQECGAAAGSATSASAAAPVAGAGGGDKAHSAIGFAARALVEGHGQLSSSREQVGDENGPPLGERLLAKGMVKGISI